MTVEELLTEIYKLTHYSHAPENIRRAIEDYRGIKGDEK